MTIPIFHYRVGYSVSADMFVAASLFAVTVGYFVIRHEPIESPASSSNIRGEAIVANWLALLGIIGSLLLLADARSRGTQVSLSYLLNNLSTIRAAVFDNLAQTTSHTAVVGSYLAPCSFLSIIAAAKLGRAGGRLLTFLASTSFVLVAIAGLFVYGGRTVLFCVISLLGISLYLGGKRIFTVTPKRLILAVLVVVGVWYFSVSWLNTREGKINTEAILLNTQRAEYRPWIAPIARRNDAVGTALISLGYFSSPLPTLSFYVQQPSRPGPFWGGYSYPLAARTLGKLTGQYGPERWFQIRAEIFAPLESAGYAGNVWGTWLRDLLVDFGYVGTVLYCFVFGAFMAWVRNHFERTGELHYHYLEVLACFTLAFGAFQSVVWYTFMANAFFVAVAIMLAVRARPSLDKRL